MMYVHVFHVPGWLLHDATLNQLGSLGGASARTLRLFVLGRKFSCVASHVEASLAGASAFQDHLAGLRVLVSPVFHSCGR